MVQSLTEAMRSAILTSTLLGAVITIGKWFPVWPPWFSRECWNVSPFSGVRARSILARRLYSGDSVRATQFSRTGARCLLHPGRGFTPVWGKGLCLNYFSRQDGKPHVDALTQSQTV